MTTETAEQKDVDELYLGIKFLALAQSVNPDWIPNPNSATDEAQREIATIERHDLAVRLTEAYRSGGPAQMKVELMVYLGKKGAFQIDDPKQAKKLIDDLVKLHSYSIFSLPVYKR